MGGAKIEGGRFVLPTKHPRSPGIIYELPVVHFWCKLVVGLLKCLGLPDFFGTGLYPAPLRELPSIGDGHLGQIDAYI